MLTSHSMHRTHFSQYIPGLISCAGVTRGTTCHAHGTCNTNGWPTDTAAATGHTHLLHLRHQYTSVVRVGFTLSMLFCFLHLSFHVHVLRLGSNLAQAAQLYSLKLADCFKYMYFPLLCLELLHVHVHVCHALT